MFHQPRQRRMVALARMMQWSKPKMVGSYHSVAFAQRWSEPPSVTQLEDLGNKPWWVWFSSHIPQNCTWRPLDGAFLFRLLWTFLLVTLQSSQLHSQPKRKGRQLGNTAPHDSRWWLFLYAKPRWNLDATTGWLATNVSVWGKRRVSSSPVPGIQNSPPSEIGGGQRGSRLEGVYDSKPWPNTGHLGNCRTSLSSPAQQPATHMALIGHFQAIK